jgi:hypothetical protein
MTITRHLVAALVIVGLAALAGIPAMLPAGGDRSIPSERLTVQADHASPPLLTAERALSPVVPAMAAPAAGNPFALRERGAADASTVPQPPPPPLTPFSPPEP